MALPSGVGTMLELARLWREQGYRPERSVLFAAWGGQELDEAGSRRFVISPTLPLTSVVAMVELESVGDGRGYYLQAQRDPTREGVLRFAIAAAANQVEGRLDLVRSERSADQEIFRRQGIPSMLLYWKGAEPRSFSAELEDEIDPQILASTGRMVGLMLMMLGR